MAVDHDGNIYEGMFANGKQAYPSLTTTETGTIAHFQTIDGKKFDIYHEQNPNYEFKILQFTKAYRHKS